jgi:choice-of-anchor B domain-containing protein
MKKLVLMAAAIACLAFTSAAGAHPLPGGFSTTGLYSGWFDESQLKVEQLQAAAAMPKPASGRSDARCENGFAGPYPCKNTDLLSNLTLPEIGAAPTGEIGNDIWGWTDPKTKREYAIMGRSDGTAFVDITNGKRPRFVANLPTEVDGPRQSWRDIKVYENHAYIVSEHIGHGMQVLDLTRLRAVNPAKAPAQFRADTVYRGGTPILSNTHNLDINEDSGFAYLVGTNTCSAGLHMVDIRDPKNPKFAGCFAQDGYTHDTQCEIYDGPDERFRGREICFASNEDTVTIVDVTDKSAPKQLSRTGYPEARYTHQGWLTEDREYFVFNDELDETGRGASLPPTAPVQTTYFLPVRSLTNPGAVTKSPNNTTSTDHNLYIEDGWIFESNYTSGLRVFDESRVPNDLGAEGAFFDVYPENDNPGFEGGTWSNYGDYRKGKVAVSSIDRGLFVVEPKPR